MKRSVVEHAVFGVLGGLVYMGIEVLWRGRSHPTMLLLGGVCFVVIGRLNERQGCAPPLWAQAVAGAAAVTLLELVTGLIVNRWLGWNVWDYSDMPLNFMGQICLPYSLAWLLLSAVAARLEDGLHALADRIWIAVWR